MAGIQGYTRKVMNKSGYVLLFPSVPTMNDLLDGSSTLNPYAISTAQEFPLGTKLINGDRVWRYTKNGATTPGAGIPLQSPVIVNQAASLDVVVDATTAAGLYTISVTSQAAIAVAADYYKEGYAFPNVGLGLGTAYKVKTHTAFVSTTAGTIVTLYDPLLVASTAGNTKWGFRKNPRDGVIATAAVLTGAPAGVSNVLLVANCYFWSQTGGPCAVITHAAVVDAAGVVVGTTAAKADPGVDNESTLQRIGFAMATSDTDAESMLVFLTLDR